MKQKSECVTAADKEKQWSVWISKILCYQSYNTIVFVLFVFLSKRKRSKMKRFVFIKAGAFEIVACGVDEGILTDRNDYSIINNPGLI